MISSLCIRLIASLLIILLLPCSSLAATNAKIVVIRDAEIEDRLYALARPLAQAAGINPNDLKLHVIKDKQINAFASPGNHIVLYTGLITACKSVDMLAGVLSHELGHLKGGHISRTQNYYDHLEKNIMVTTILGVASMVLLGAPEVGIGMTLGGVQTARMQAARFSQEQEHRADQAGFDILTKAGYDPAGLVDLLYELSRQEKRDSLREMPDYLRSHPFSEARVGALKHRLAAVSGHTYPAKPLSEEAFQRIQLKLYAFTHPAYKEAPALHHLHLTGNAATYYEAMRAMVNANHGPALSAIRTLIRTAPKDPYYLQLEAQMLLEKGDAIGAIASYQKAVTLQPSSPMLHLELAHALLCRYAANFNERLASNASPQEIKHGLEEAIRHLQAVIKREPANGLAYRFLGNAYEGIGNPLMAHLMLAEEALLAQQTAKAKQLAQKVLDQAREGSKEALKAQDILTSIK